MIRGRILLFTVLVIILAGCAGSDGDLKNPYEKEELNLYINDSLEDRDLTPEIESAIVYWETHSREYVDYNISYTIVDSREDADVKIVFDDVRACGLTYHSTEYVGCADIVEDKPSGVVEVEIQHGLAQPIAEETIKHELGHTLGLNHGDEPSPLMDAEPTSLNKTNPIQIYMWTVGSNDNKRIFGEIETALEYYNEHPELNESESLNYRLVDDRSEAHIEIMYSPDGQRCHGIMGGSCTVAGDYGGQEKIRLENLKHDVVAWHVANALSPHFFSEPPPDLEADTYEERKDWPGAKT